MPPRQSIEAWLLDPNAEYLRRVAWKTTPTRRTESPAREARHQHHSMHRPQRTPPLLKLPAELRTYIYELALIENRYIKIDHALKEPAILRTCVQIRAEAPPIYYQKNTFWSDILFGDAMIMNAWSTRSLASNFKDIDLYAIIPAGWKHIMSSRIGQELHSYSSDELFWTHLSRWGLEIWSCTGARTIPVVKGMSRTERLIC